VGIPPKLRHPDKIFWEKALRPKVPLGAISAMAEGARERNSRMALMEGLVARRIKRVEKLHSGLPVQNVRSQKR